jgi:hypothetical protein
MGYSAKAFGAGGDLWRTAPGGDQAQAERWPVGVRLPLRIASASSGLAGLASSFRVIRFTLVKRSTTSCAQAPSAASELQPGECRNAVSLSSRRWGVTTGVIRAVDRSAVERENRDRAAHPSPPYPPLASASSEAPRTWSSTAWTPTRMGRLSIRRGRLPPSPAGLNFPLRRPSASLAPASTTTGRASARTGGAAALSRQERSTGLSSSVSRSQSVNCALTAGWPPRCRRVHEGRKALGGHVLARLRRRLSAAGALGGPGGRSRALRRLGEDRLRRRGAARCRAQLHSLELAEGRVQREDQRPPRFLVEVEVVSEIAQNLRALTYIRS